MSDDTLTRGAYRGALIAASLTAFGMPVELLIGRGVPGFLAWPPLATCAVGWAMLGLLLHRRHHMTVGLAAFTFLITNLAIIVGLTITNGELGRGGVHWTPFQANNLGSLAAALLAPEIWSGALVIAGFAGSASLQYLWFPPEVRAHLPVGLPWTTLVYGGFGIALLLHHLRQKRMQLKLANARAEKVALERMAERVMAIRDLTNTPLQTLELTAALLRKENPKLGAELDRVDRALQRLRELRGLLSGFESNERWSKEQTSLDARAKLER